jgi:hypothetical protein
MWADAICLINSQRYVSVDNIPLCVVFQVARGPRASALASLGQMSKAVAQRPLLFRWLRRQDSRVSAENAKLPAVFFPAKTAKTAKKARRRLGLRAGGAGQMSEKAR